MLLEICTPNYESVLTASQCGVKRIELCSELAVGGITPSYGLIKKVMTQFNLEVLVLVRPRSGDFYYSQADFKIMKQDIKLCKKMGCHGIVSGILNSDQTIDSHRTHALVDLSYPLPFIFHRAFDHVPHQEDALEKLIAMGVKRVLTSGGAASANEGFEKLLKLKSQAKNRITIMPGGGIQTAHIKQFKESGFTEIHTSATKLVTSTQTTGIPMNNPKSLQENSYLCSSERIINDLLLVI